MVEQYLLYHLPLLSTFPCARPAMPGLEQGQMVEQGLLCHLPLLNA